MLILLSPSKTHSVYFKGSILGSNSSGIRRPQRKSNYDIKRRSKKRILYRPGGRKIMLKCGKV